MRKAILLSFLSIFLVTFLGADLTVAEEKIVPTNSGQITLPWEKLENLLNLSKGTVTLEMDEFAMIMRQTESKDLPDYLVKEGKIVMKREDFKRLLKLMKPANADSSLGEYVVTKADYSAEMGKNSTSVRATFNLRVLPRRGREDLVLVPLVRNYVALRKVTVDGNPAIVGNTGGFHAVALSREGSHTAVVDFTLASDLKTGPQSISFPVLKTPITLLKLEIPLPSVQPEINGATSIKRKDLGKSTIIDAVLQPTNNINVAWSRLVPEAEKGPAKIYADIWQLLSIEDDALRIKMSSHIKVLHNTINKLTFKIPENYQLLDVTGQVVSDWKEKTIKDQNMLFVSLKTPRQGDFYISMRAERISEDKTTVADFDGFAIPDTVREKGYIAVEMKGSAEAKVTEANGVDRASFSELPSQLTSMSEKPLIFAYKYLHHPYNIILDVQKHEELPVITTVVDNASGITLFTEDGKMVHQLTYTVRNTWKQFMELNLPADSDLWSTFVNGEPVKPIKNEKGKILIPLNRSKTGDGGLSPFDIEVIYAQKAGKFHWLGWKKTSFGIPDLMMARVIWSLYLPFGYSFVHFGGNMEKEKIAKGIRPLLGLAKRNVDYESLRGIAAPSSANEEAKMEPQAKRRRQSLSLMKKRKALGSDFGKNIAIGEMDIVDQLSKEMDFSQKAEKPSISGKAGILRGGGSVTGVMPIRVQVPTIGQVYRFAKQISRDEPLTVSFTYLSDTLFNTIKIIIVLLILFLCYCKRGFIKNLYSGFRAWHEVNLAKHVTSLNVMIVAAAMFLFSMFVFHPIFKALFLFIFLVSMAYHLILYLKKRSESKVKKREDIDKGE